MAADSEFSWLGTYALLAYAMQSSNASLLREAIESSSSVRGQFDFVDEAIANGSLLLAELTGRYDELALMIETNSKIASREELLARSINNLIRVNNFKEVRIKIDDFRRNFGPDLAAAHADLALTIMTSPFATSLLAVDKYLRSYPNSHELLITKAHVLFGQERNKALALLERLKKAKNKSAYLRLLVLEMRVRFEERHLKRTLLDVNSVASIYEDYPRFHALAAMANISLRNFVKAEDHLNRADRQSPNFYDAALARAELFLSSGRAVESIALLSAQLVREPNDLTAQLLLVQALIEATRVEEAGTLLRQIKQSVRYSPGAYVASLEQQIVQKRRETAAK